MQVPGSKDQIGSIKMLGFFCKLKSCGSLELFCKKMDVMFY